MNTNNLKRFAREARIKLIDQVGRKLAFVLSNTDPVFIDTNATQIQSLKNKIQAQGKEHVIDTVAYTWFNRLMALRFMDANGYTSPKVVTPVVGKSPEILQNALSGQIDENLKINRQRLNDLLDGKLVIADAQTEAYKMLLIASCNQWHTAMPFMFERISDYTELLLPDDLLSENSIITDIRNGMSEDDCGQEELIGWLYQFYIADKKDDVFEGLKKNIKITAENIPAATQLFTPRWIVRYMVENTLGKLWLTLKPNSKIRQFMPYYIEAPEGNAPAPLPEGIKGVTDITFLDPCQGSGHVLVYAFDLFTKIYEEEGYNTNEIPALILEHNLFGIDIDERAAQLAAFALTMKARSYFSRFLRKPVQPHVIALENVNEDIIKQAVKLPLAVAGKLVYDYRDLTLYNLTQADNFGSLIQIDPEELKALSIQKGSIWQAQEQKLKEQAQYLSRQYHCVVTNPPYMGWKGMNEVLRRYVEEYYYDSRTDLMASFIERCINICSANGYSALINQQTWMFISSYEDLRHKILSNYFISTLLHLGLGVFKELNTKVVQSVALTIQNIKNPTQESTFFDLREGKDLEEKEEFFKQNQFKKSIQQENLLHIPGYTLAYWLNDEGFKIFDNQKISDYATLFQGMITGDNKKFVRAWQEVSFKKISIGNEEFIKNNYKIKSWVPYNKGGESLKWYGNHDYVVNFKNDGEDFTRGKLQFKNYFFKEYVTWSYISLSLVARYFPKGFVWDVAGSGLFPNKKEDLFYITSLLTSKVGNFILKVLNPTLNFQVENIAAVPLIYPSDSEYSLIIDQTEKLVNRIQQIHDNNETTWGFKCLPFIKQGFTIMKSINEYQESVKKNYFEIHKIEEDLNKKFISIYSLNDSVNHFIEFQDLTAYNQELNREGLLVLNKTIVREQISGDVINYEALELPIIKEVIYEQLFSFSIGCILGRFSLDKPGLMLANQGETFEDFLKQVPNPSFMPDEDNIIPVLEGEWFNDDIVGRFKVFLKVAFGEVHFEENLKYIEDTIGKDIRKYFVKDFYNDHIKRYKKRPIYWMFSSPKGHFKALIYMHRYTPDLCSKMLTDYLQSYINKLEAAQQNKIAESLREDLPARDKTAATKEADRYSAMIKDCKEYAQTLYAVATKKITIDLDDGVKVNYQKFKEVVVPIKGLEKDEE
jgi:hypothetical protein